MAWFRKERKPRTPVRERREIPADAWIKCDRCDHLMLREKFERSLRVCPECGFHARFTADGYIELLTDEGSWKELWTELRSVDPLQFEHYAQRTAAALKKAGTSDAILVGQGRLDGTAYHLGAMNFSYMGGSMGSVVGEKITRLANRSTERHWPLVLVCTSGGARMQEGVLSLMQMAKTSAAIAQLGAQGVPFVTVLTDPTTGGVSASFAMQGDVILAEPAAVIGFAGQRVIKQTIGQDLPEGFQTAEFLLDHGQVDEVVPRPALRETLSRLVRHMAGRKVAVGE